MQYLIIKVQGNWVLCKEPGFRFKKISYRNPELILVFERRIYWKPKTKPEVKVYGVKVVVYEK